MFLLNATTFRVYNWVVGEGLGDNGNGVGYPGQTDSFVIACLVKYCNWVKYSTRVSCASDSISVIKLIGEAFTQIALVSLVHSMAYILIWLWDWILSDYYVY